MAVPRTRLVTFEGIDGAGKSTLISGVETALAARGVDALFTREETNTWIGEGVKRSIADRTDPLTTLYLFLADRAEHLAALRPRLDEGGLVFSDRYHDSTRAYQAVTLADRFGGVASFEKWLAAQVAPWLVPPARTYLLDVKPAQAVSRMGERPGTTIYERSGFLTKVREQYLRLAKFEPDRWVVLDGSLGPHELVSKVVEDLERCGLLEAPAAPDR